MRELANLKLLIVDDESEILDILEMYLSRHGATVLRASNGLSAYETFLSNQVDVVLTDVMMPGQNADGITLTKKLRALNAQGPLVIVITGFSKETEAEAIAAGANHVLGKPFNLEGIKNLLRDLKINN